MICDVGALDGGDSIRMRQLVVTAKMFAFEANSRNHARYYKEVRKARIHYENLAITDYDGEITFNIVSESGVTDEDRKWTVAGQSSILAPVDDLKILEPIKVPCRRLDTIVLPRISDDATIALWIDAEGAGYEVILGAPEILNRTRLIKIETEIWPHLKDKKLIGDIRALPNAAGLIEIVNNDRNYGQCDLLWIRA